jgi:hypothetical protein
MIHDDINLLLTDGGFSDGLYLLNLPTLAPLSYVVVRFYAGQPPMRSAGGVVAELPRMQIEVSDPSTQTAAIKAEAIKQYLDGTKDVVLNGTTYFWIASLGDPVIIGRTEKDYPRYVCNYEIFKQQSTL